MINAVFVTGAVVYALTGRVQARCQLQRKRSAYIIGSHRPLPTRRRQTAGRRRCR